MAWHISIHYFLEETKIVIACAQNRMVFPEMNLVEWKISNQLNFQSTRFISGKTSRVCAQAKIVLPVRP